MSQKLALFPLTLADRADTAAYGVILLLVLAIGFAMAWAIQTVRRQRAVRQLIERQLEDERAQVEESRLLAEDLLQEQATLIAQQDRRIEHLKGRLARQIAQQQRERPVHRHQADASPPHTGTPRIIGAQEHGVSTQTVGTPPSAIAPTTTTRHDDTPRSQLVEQTVAMATRAAALRRVRLSTHLLAGTPQAAATGAPLDQAAAPLTMPMTQIRPDGHTTSWQDPARNHAMLQALGRQLRLERAASREKARLVRHFEHDAAHWQQSWQQAETQRAALQQQIDILQKQLEQSREQRANAECALQRLREQLQQQQAHALMDGAELARKATSFRLRDTVHYPDDAGTLLPNTQIRYPHLGHNRPPASNTPEGTPRRPS